LRRGRMQEEMQKAELTEKREGGHSIRRAKWWQSI